MSSCSTPRPNPRSSLLGFRSRTCPSRAPTLPQSSARRAQASSTHKRALRAPALLRVARGLGVEDALQGLEVG